MRGESRSATETTCLPVRSGLRLQSPFTSSTVSGVRPSPGRGIAAEGTRPDTVSVTTMTAQSAWDSESRKSPYSTVADPEDETCECCGGAGCEDCTESAFVTDEVTVTIELGSQESGWRFANEATCSPDAAVYTARSLWDETATEVQGRKRRLTYSASAHGMTERRSTEVRP